MSAAVARLSHYDKYKLAQQWLPLKLDAVMFDRYSTDVLSPLSHAEHKSCCVLCPLNLDLESLKTIGNAMNEDGRYDILLLY